MERMYKVQEVAEMFDVSNKTVYRWKNKGLISCIKVDRALRFPESEIQRIKEVHNGRKVY